MNAWTVKILSLSTEYPNPAEAGKGLFVRARLQAMAKRVDLTLLAPVALLDYANPHKRLFGSRMIPRCRIDGQTRVWHMRWLYPPKGGWVNAFCLFGRLLWPVWRLRRARQ